MCYIGLERGVMLNPSEEIMRELIHDQRTKDSIYAAVVSPEGEIIAKGHTTVNKDNDPSAHAEINAIREACKMLGLSRLGKGYWLYTTFEPCPLCSSAIIWAGIDGVVYANNPGYRGKEDNWSFIPCREMLQRGKYLHQVKLVENFLIDEIKDYFN